MMKPLITPLFLMLLQMAALCASTDPSSTSSSSRSAQSEQATASLRRGVPNRSLESDSTPDPELRIINGNEVRENRYPYFSLMYGRSMCGAVLIGPRLALGAAHCFGASSDLRVGARDGVDSGQRINIRGAIIHPLRDNRFFGYDIVMFYLEEATDIPYIQPDSTEITSAGTKLTVIGFGDTDPSFGVELADTLNEVELEYVDTKKCNKRHGDGDQITDDMMCAASNDKDSCVGDSGGPLIRRGSDASQDRLVGIVSWGRGCANDEFPGVYVRISHVHDWIVETACDNFPNDLPTYMNCELLYGTGEPSASPSAAPTNLPTPIPTASPSTSPPTRAPSRAPVTAAAVSAPTEAPSKAPVSPTAPDGTLLPSPVTLAPAPATAGLEFIAWSPSQQLKICQGDCDSDADCEGDLVCMVRTEYAAATPVPGCENIDGLSDIIDFCVDGTLLDGQQRA
mmetsp:Transcript_19237/g.35933  ORF Transcript_19237/g.35933 Transcript_19237/m.35933 type:complete len:454 (-) Transcript_19237:176-1537(-)